MPCAMPKDDRARQPSDVVSVERGWPNVVCEEILGGLDSALAIQVKIWGERTCLPKVLSSLVTESWC
jgi:hypothetical protein